VGRIRADAGNLQELLQFRQIPFGGLVHVPILEEFAGGLPVLD
jgi:hypothetical protein